MSPPLPLSKDSFDTFLSLRKLLKFGQVWLKFGVVSEIRATHGEHPRSDKRDGYREDMSSCIGQSPRYSPGKWILEEWYDCIYIYIKLVDAVDRKWRKAAWSVGVSIVDEEEFRDLKTSRWKIRLLASKAREGSRGGNEGASSDWSGREEIASRLVIITPLTRLPLPPIVLSIIFVIELLATKSPSTAPTPPPPPPPFLSTSLVYLVQSRPTTTVSLSSTSISSRVQHSIFDTSCGTNVDYRFASNTPCVSTMPRYLRLPENSVYFFRSQRITKHEQDIIFKNFEFIEHVISKFSIDRFPIWNSIRQKHSNREMCNRKNSI